jgi:restriction system protein
LESQIIKSIDPQSFELIVAELLTSMGYEVIITQYSKDKGRDILASIQTPLGKLLTVVECKRYRSDRPIGVEPVQRLLWVAENVDKASSALLVTTSRFTSGAKAIEKQHQYKLFLCDFQNLAYWIERYGDTNQFRNNIIWVPNTIYKPI